MNTTIEIRETERGFEVGFTAYRIEDGKVTGSTQQWATWEEVAAALATPPYAWMHRSDKVCVNGCENLCWGHT